MKRRFNWAIPGLLAMLAIIAGIALAQSLSAASPDPARLATQCSDCHAMEDHVTTWQASAHQNVACTDCHADPGVWGWMEVQVGRVRMAMAEARDPSAGLGEVATEVTNERCLNCHAAEMPWVMQDLQPPVFDEEGKPIRVAREELQFLGALAGHDLHLTLEQPLACTDCHAGVAHGPSEQVDRAAAWHNTCLECHTEENVAMAVRNTISCSACHVDLPSVAPDTHKDSGFRVAHGKQAVQEPQSCQLCHLNPGIMTVESGQSAHAQQMTLAAGETREPWIPLMEPGSLRVPPGMQDDCASCHGITMPHPDDWLRDHTNGYAENPALCATCHGAQGAGFANNVLGDPRTLPTEDPLCITCHAQPMPHPADWLTGGHQAAAQAQPLTCEQCHSPSNPANPDAEHASPLYCAECHLSTFVHPDGFFAKHGKAALSGDVVGENCFTCHIVEGVKKGLAALTGRSATTCAECHTDGFASGVEQQWHPSDWIRDHGSVALNASGAISQNCASCHKPEFNSCAECHTDGVGRGIAQQWHPEAWVRDHQSVALDSRGAVAEDCATCHTPTFNSCAECHTDGFGQGVKQEWHPEFFWVTHSRTTRPEDVESCQSCHAYVEPSCAQCHRGY